MLEIPRVRRRWLLFAASLLLIVPALGWLAMRVDPVRHASARSLRLAVGAPEPPPMFAESLVPALGAEPEAPALAPRRPAGLDGVSFVLLLGADNRSDKIVFFASISEAKFRKPVVPGDQLRLEVSFLKLKASVAKVLGKATVDGSVVAEAEIVATLADRPKA